MLGPLHCFGAHTQVLTVCTVWEHSQCFPHWMSLWVRNRFLLNLSLVLLDSHVHSPGHLWHSWYCPHQAFYLQRQRPKYPNHLLQSTHSYQNSFSRTLRRRKNGCYNRQNLVEHQLLLGHIWSAPILFRIKTNTQCGLSFPFPWELSLSQRDVLESISRFYLCTHTSSAFNCSKFTPVMYLWHLPIIYMWHIPPRWERKHSFKLPESGLLCGTICKLCRLLRTTMCMLCR